MNTWVEEQPWVWDGPAPVELQRFVAPSAVTTVTPPSQQSIWAGDKWEGSFGATQLFDLDYWTLRARSGQLFRENLYARGMLRRLITNEINTGLSLEARPEETLLGLVEDSLADWSEDQENRFSIWANNPKLCDYQEQRTFAELQSAARLESLISGDVLVVLHQNPFTKLPQIELVNGGHVQSPLGPTEATIIDGVEVDKRKRHVAYHVTLEDGTSRRIAAWGGRSGRRIAWLVYGAEKRIDDIRGEPILGILLQSLKEIDRYRDSVQRKATINSILAMFIQKDEAKIGTMPLTGGAVTVGQATQTNDASTGPRTFNIAQYMPGVIIDELQHGEKIVPAGNQGIDEKFGEFEEAIIQAMAWCLEVPPEIMRLTFSNNYSASQAAINELRMYLNRIRTWFAAQFCKPVYCDWFISETLTGRITADGFLEAWRDPLKYDQYGAWIASDWSGAIKPSTDLVKQAKGYKLMVDQAWITNGRSSRELTGTKFSRNVRRLKIENEQLVEALKPLVEFVENNKESEVAKAILARVA